MDFIDELRQFAKRAESIKDMLPTEEATKNSLILPFFQLLGYDVFNPMEFMPEFTADVGIKKGEKVDYAIILDSKPAILIEAKWCGDPLDGHDSQLFRYFGTTSAKFGILTNGLVYRFFTDLDEPNKMDLTPFLELNLLDLNENTVAEVKRFAKERIDIDEAFSAASELKYTNLIKGLLQKQRVQPDEEFVNYVLGEIYPGRRTQPVVEKFTAIIKKALNAYLNDVINETLKNAMQKSDEKEDSTTEPIIEPPEEVSKIITTQEELEAYSLVKTLAREALPVDRISYKDTENYFAILVDDSVRKWICRIRFGTQKNTLIIHSLEGDLKYAFSSVDEIYEYKDQIIEAAKIFA